MPLTFEPIEHEFIDVVKPLLEPPLAAGVLAAFLAYNYETTRSAASARLRSRLGELKTANAEAELQAAIDRLLSLDLLEERDAWIRLHEGWRKAFDVFLESVPEAARRKKCRMLASKIRKSPERAKQIEQGLISRIGPRLSEPARETFRRVLSQARERVRIATYSSVSFADEIIPALVDRWVEHDVCVELLMYSPKLAVAIEHSAKNADDVKAMTEKWRKAFDAARTRRAPGKQDDRGLHIRWINDEVTTNFGRIVLVDDHDWLLTVSYPGVSPVLEGIEYGGRAFGGDRSSNVYAILDRYWNDVWSTALRMEDRHRAFIIHGRNTADRDRVEAFLNDAKFETVILAKQPDRPGETIIDKFTRIFKPGAFDLAVAILSPDDLGRFAKNEEAQQRRARQNVVFEVGYAYAMVGKDNTLLIMPASLETEKTEIWSDIQGVMYLTLDDGDHWKEVIGNSLRAWMSRGEYSPESHPG